MPAPRTRPLTDAPWLRRAEHAVCDPVPVIVIDARGLADADAAARLGDRLMDAAVLALVTSGPAPRDAMLLPDGWPELALDAIPRTPPQVEALRRRGVPTDFAWPHGFLDAFALAGAHEIPAFASSLAAPATLDDAVRSRLLASGALVLGRSGRLTVFDSRWRAVLDGFAGCPSPTPTPSAPWRAGVALRASP